MEAKKKRTKKNRKLLNYGNMLTKAQTTKAKRTSQTRWESPENRKRPLEFKSILSKQKEMRPVFEAQRINSLMIIFIVLIVCVTV